MEFSLVTKVIVTAISLSYTPFTRFIVVVILARVALTVGDEPPVAACAYWWSQASARRYFRNWLPLITFAASFRSVFGSAVACSPLGLITAEPTTHFMRSLPARVSSRR